MDAWKVYIEKLKKKPYSAFGLILLLALPLTLALVFRVNDVRTRASLPNQLEAEDGVLTSSGVSKQSDSGASGGQYIEFNKSNSENPTFLSRPSSNPIVKDGGQNVVIENVSIQGDSVSNPTGQGIIIRNVSGSITIRNVDLANLQGGIYIYNSTGTIIIENVRSRNIGTKTSSNSDIGSGKSNHIQFAESSLSGYVRNNKFLGGRTEDMVSTWHSGGRGAGQELIFENNQFQGLVNDTSTARAWDSTSGTGIIIGDGGGSSKNGYIIVRNNTFLTPGQVGIQHIDGPGIQTYGNIIYGEKRPQNNNPMTSWEGNPRGEVHDNRYFWVNNDGSEPSPWFTSYGSLNVYNNTKDSSINPADLIINLDSNLNTTHIPPDAIYVPESIDSTGSTDAQPKLQSFIDNAPDGSYIVFKNGGIYKFGTVLKISGRNDLTLDGNGAQILMPTVDLDRFRSQGIQVLGGSDGTVIRNFKITGNNYNAGTKDALDASQQSSNAIAVLSANNTLIENVDISRIWADCLYIHYGYGSEEWSDGVIFRNSNCTLTGRHAVAIIAGSNVLIENNTVDKLGMHFVDIEPNVGIDGANNVMMRNNHIGSYSLTDQFWSWILAACGVSGQGTNISNITLTNNTIEGNSAGYDGRMNGLHVRVCGDRGIRSNYTVTDNISLSSAEGPTMTFTEVQGLTVTGNTQPLSSGNLVSYPGSANVNISNNQTN